MNNYRVLFIIVILSLFYLVRLSVLLNLFTLAILGGVVALSYMVYMRREDRGKTVENIGDELMTDPLVVGRAYFSEPAVGPIGDFVGVSSWPNDERLEALSDKVA